MISNTISVEQSLVYKALERLDEELAALKVEPFEINVVGGFALMIEGVRFSDRTDIDYVGYELDREIRRLADQIGLEIGLGRGWLNNDIMMAGSSLEDLEWSTGTLHFKKAFELEIITVNSLDLNDLLRMKVIAIDTSYTAVECGGDFTREKDFEDIRLILENLGMSYNDMVQEVFYYVECKEILFLIRWYINHPNDLSFMVDGRYKKIIASKGKSDQ